MGCIPKTHRKQGKKLAQAARLWASGQLATTKNHDDDDDAAAQDTAAALAVWGLQADTDHLASQAAAPKLFCIWPDCVGTWSIWQRLQTQWRMSANGREGLDYAGVTAYLQDVLRVKHRDFARVFGEIQAMEAAALEAWAKQREQTK